MDNEIKRILIIEMLKDYSIDYVSQYIGVTKSWVRQSRLKGFPVGRYKSIVKRIKEGKIHLIGFYRERIQYQLNYPGFEGCVAITRPEYLNGDNFEPSIDILMDDDSISVYLSKLVKRLSNGRCFIVGYVQKRVLGDQRYLIKYIDSSTNKLKTIDFYELQASKNI